MFIGEYNHILDPKKRLALPAKFRAEFADGAVVTRGLDKCLFIYAKKQWEQIAEKLGAMPIGEAGTRSFVRLMLSGAFESPLDSQGRVLIPDYLKDYAGLDKKITVAGLYNRLELWDEQSWLTYKQSVETNQEAIAEQLGKLGVF